MIQRYQLDEFKKEFLNENELKKLGKGLELDQKRDTKRDYALSDKTMRDASFDSNYSELSYMEYRVDKSFENPKSGLYTDLMDYNKADVSQKNDTRPASL